MGNVTSYVKYGASSPHLQLIASQDREKIKRNNVNLSGIVCTIGPASTNEDILVEMMRAGMRIARLNFSHGSHAEHADRIKTIRRAMKLYQDRYNHPCPLGIALDTKGPEIRTGIIEQGETSKVELKEGSFVKITPKPQYKEKCNDKIIYIDYQILLQKIKVGQEIYIDDGKIILKSVAVEHDFVECKVVNGGLLGSKKGVALPGVQIDLPVISDQDKEDLKFAIDHDIDSVQIDLPVISDQDKEDLKFAIDHDIDIIFASFIKNTQDIKQIRDALGDRGRNILIVAKIESEEVLKKGEMLMDRSAGCC
ncbi:Pyruvate kinase, barrel domain [Popillia japonica]|uniref:pyruvate kinase n=1 Tax=Popillia japonica TaxID=7064 RepID=A0AAW1LX59_POPJA